MKLKTEQSVQPQPRSQFLVPQRGRQAWGWARFELLGQVVGRPDTVTADSLTSSEARAAERPGDFKT